jgi:DNA mismatch repair protein MutS
VPPDYVRKQTIAGGERFITPELKQHEDRVLRADELIVERELAIFEALRAGVAAAARRVQQTSRATAALDVLASLAEAATRFDYVKPRLSRGDELVYVEGRHPIMERVLREPLRRERPRDGRRRGEAVRAHRARTWAASPPSCARRRSSC